MVEKVGLRLEEKESLKKGIPKSIDRKTYPAIIDLG